MEQMVGAIVNWLKEQVRVANADGLVVGLSGGIDSAVVANLIKRAFPHDSLAVIMPIQSNPQDLHDANKVVEACNIKHVTIDLTAFHQMMFDTIRQTIKQNGTWNEANERIADANLRARLRMSTLYTLAANYRYLVVGTDNAAEWYTGYFTKYGDGGVDLQPIIDLTKSEVVEMARFLHVPETVINKKPSADLWVGQTDEAELGTTYEMIDRYLNGESIPAKDKQIIERLHRTTEHKRQIAKQFRFK